MYDATQFESRSANCDPKLSRHHPYVRTTRSSTLSSSDAESFHSDREEDDDDFEVSAHPTARRKRKDHIPRPPNAFILYRSELCKECPERNNRHISQIAGVLWRNMSEEKKDFYRAQAAQALAEHKLKYPNYKFSPVAKGGSERRKCKESTKAEARRCKAIAILILDGYKGEQLEQLKKLMDRNGNIPGVNTTTIADGAAVAKSTQRKARSRGRKQSNTPCDVSHHERVLDPATPPTVTPELSPASSECSSPITTPTPLLTPVLHCASELPIAAEDRTELDPDSECKPSDSAGASDGIANLEVPFKQVVVPDEEVCSALKFILLVLMLRSIRTLIAIASTHHSTSPHSP